MRCVAAPHYYHRAITTAWQEALALLPGNAQLEARIASLEGQVAAQDKAVAAAKAKGLQQELQQEQDHDQAREGCGGEWKRAVPVCVTPSAKAKRPKEPKEGAASAAAGGVSAVGGHADGDGGGGGGGAAGPPGGDEEPELADSRMRELHAHMQGLLEREIVNVLNCGVPAQVGSGWGSSASIAARATLLALDTPPQAATGTITETSQTSP